jgi:hypothetical protein
MQKSADMCPRPRVPRLAAVLAAAAALAGVPDAAGADGDYFTQTPPDHLTYRVEGERTRGQRIVIGSLLGGTLVGAGVGVLLHRAASSASDDVSARSGDHTSRIYTREIDDRREQAIRYGTGAIVAYGVGAACAAGTVVALIVTAPDSRLVEYRGGRVDVPVVTPVPGGLVLERSWSF